MHKNNRVCIIRSRYSTNKHNSNLAMNRAIEYDRITFAKIFSHFKAHRHITHFLKWAATIIIMKLPGRSEISTRTRMLVSLRVVRFSRHMLRNTTSHWARHASIRARRIGYLVVMFVPFRIAGTSNREWRAIDGQYSQVKHTGYCLIPQNGSKSNSDWGSGTHGHNYDKFYIWFLRVATFERIQCGEWELTERYRW